MKRNLKALGLALAAVFAMSAVAASGASAHYTVTPGASPAWITGDQIANEPTGNKFLVGESGARVECNKAHFEGTTEGAALGEVTVTPTYSECTTHASGIEAPAVVDMNGCDYLLTGETGPNNHGLVHVKCPAGKVIEITTPSVNCTVKVHEQTPTSGGISYENSMGTPDDTTATATSEGITFERAGGILCAASGIPSEGNNAKLFEKITIKAFKDIEGKEGEQVNLTVS